MNSFVWHFINQFKSPLIYLLLVATLISFLLDRGGDAILVLFVLIINAILGAVQEYRANKAAEALKVYLKPKAKVIRDGKELKIDADQLMLKDTIILEAGDMVPADGILTESHFLKVNESALTGESLPVDKKQNDNVFAGTLVVAGRALAQVEAVGSESRIGKLAQFVSEAKETISPLKRKLALLARQLLNIISVSIGAIFLLGTISGFEIETMFVTSVALAVASVPEGLPIALTVVLTIGMYRMAKRKAIIKRLDAVESLGSVTTICIDKTGTLTTGEIMVEKIVVDNSEITVTGTGFNPAGEFLRDGRKLSPDSFSENLAKLVKVAALNNDSRLRTEGGEIEVVGDPTEAALLILAKKSGIDLLELAKRYPRIAEFPFDPKLKYMATLNLNYGKTFTGKQILTLKGAPTAILEICDVTKEEKAFILKHTRKLASNGLRVIAFGYLSIYQKWQGAIHELISKHKPHFLGLVGLLDPIRPETVEMVSKIKAAGIRLVMITGDHRLTALAIAKRAGIDVKKGQLINSDELESVSDESLAKIVNNAVIFSRVTPDQKTRIVKALQNNGEIVAMTGDGVNDGPALVSADVGIGMGKIGTDVAKEASDLVITDDNLATIFAAVEEGRVIFANIKKLVLYLVSGSLSGLVLIASSLLVMAGIPLTIGQILWINLITDTFPDIALAFDPKEAEIMQGRQNLSIGNIFDRKGQFMVVIVALISGLVSLAIFEIARAYFSESIARTLTFAVFAVNTLVYVFSIRSIGKPFWRSSVFSNKFLNIAILLSLGLLFISIYFKPLAIILDNEQLSFWYWLVVMSVAILVFGLIELVKLLSINLFTEPSQKRK